MYLQSLAKLAKNEGHNGHMLLLATAANVAARDEWLVGSLPRWKWLMQYMRSDMDEVFTSYASPV